MADLKLKNAPASTVVGRMGKDMQDKDVNQYQEQIALSRNQLAFNAQNQISQLNAFTA